MEGQSYGRDNDEDAEYDLAKHESQSCRCESDDADCPIPVGILFGIVPFGSLPGDDGFHACNYSIYVLLFQQKLCTRAVVNSARHDSLKRKEIYEYREPSWNCNTVRRAKDGRIFQNANCGLPQSIDGQSRPVCKSRAGPAGDRAFLFSYRIASRNRSIVLAVRRSDCFKAGALVL